MYNPWDRMGLARQNIVAYQTHPISTFCILILLGLHECAWKTAFAGDPSSLAHKNMMPIQVRSLDSSKQFIFACIQLTIHSKKFKMNEEVDSFLSEKVSNLLLT